jgi:hypothetical protein
MTSTIPDPRLNPVLDKENAMKDIFGSIEEIGLWM